MYPTRPLPTRLRSRRLRPLACTLGGLGWVGEAAAAAAAAAPAAPAAAAAAGGEGGGGGGGGVGRGCRAAALTRRTLEGGCGGERGCAAGEGDCPAPATPPPPAPGLWPATTTGCVSSSPSSSSADTARGGAEGRGREVWGVALAGLLLPGGAREEGWGLPGGALVGEEGRAEEGTPAVSSLEEDTASEMARPRGDRRASK